MREQKMSHYPDYVSAGSHNLEGGAIMAEMTKRTEGKEELLQKKIIMLVKGINDECLLDRIYKFVKYIYIYKNK